MFSLRFALLSFFTDQFRIFHALTKDLSCFAVSLLYSVGFQLTCALLRKYRDFRSNNAFSSALCVPELLFPRFRGIVARTQSFPTFYTQFTLLYRFSDNSPVFALSCAFLQRKRRNLRSACIFRYLHVFLFSSKTFPSSRIKPPNFAYFGL